MIEWPLTTAACGAGVRVGVVDTGINRADPMLAGSRIETASFTQSPGSVSTDHGTAIAILLVGGEAGGFAGLVPAAELYGADVFERIGGEVEATTDALVNALDWLAGRDVDIVNMSLSGPNHPLLEAAINALTARGVLVVAAAGNGGPTAAPAFPGAYSQVLSVSAVDRLMRPYRQANRGDYITFAAPGVNLPLPGTGSRSEWSGTSFASAYLTGVVAEILADNRARDAAGVIRTLQSSALDLGSPGRDAVFGWGLPRYQPSCQ
ncbi:MAG: S8 family serine peptidase [Pseudomonadota bacterium]